MQLVKRNFDVSETHQFSSGLTSERSSDFYDSQVARRKRRCVWSGDGGNNKKHYHLNCGALLQADVYLQC